MSKKLGRNDPCWCGSGKKYKKCHLDRNKENPVNPWQVEDQLKQKFGKKYCSVPESLKGECDGKIIRSHTVGKSASLESIAEKGHVYGYKPSFANLNKNKGILIPELIGINQASTYTGFCARHDREMFLPIDNQPFAVSEEQVFLITYRAFSREVFTKKAHAESIELIKEMDRGRGEMEQTTIQEYALLMQAVVNAGLRDNSIYKNKFDEILVNRNFSEIDFWVLKLENPPDIMGAGAFSPEFDFKGNRLQDLADLDVTFDLITYSSLASGDKGFFLFSWLKENMNCFKFVKSLKEIGQNKIPNSIVRMLFQHSENLFLRPAWWESLDDNPKAMLNDKMLIGIHPGKGVDSNGLLDDGVDYVDWRINEVVSGNPELNL